MDFNPTFFSHANAADGFTLTHRDPAIRNYWIEHGIACRNIGAAMGKQLGTPAVTNVWIPDGYKDTPVDRTGPRERLTDSLDRIFADPFDLDRTGVKAPSSYGLRDRWLDKLVTRSGRNVGVFVGTLLQKDGK